MSVNVEPRFRNGESVYVLLENGDGTEGCYEAIILDQEYEDFFTKTDYYTLAVQLPVVGWTVFAEIPRAQLLPDTRRRPPGLHAERGASCHYVVINWWGREEATDAVIIDRNEHTGTYCIARRAYCPENWEIARDVDAAFVSFGAYNRGERFVIE